MSRIDSVLRVLERQRARRLHPGAQIYVSQWGETLLDTAVGVADHGVPLTSQHLMRWYDGSKPLVAVAVLQQVESGRLSLDTTVGEILPWWPASLGVCTVRHLLTHTAGLESLDPGDELLEDKPFWDALLELTPDAVPGTRAHFDRVAAWRVLARVVEEADGRDFEWYLREQIWEPLQMDSTYLALGSEDIDRLGSWVVPVHWTGLHQEVRLPSGATRKRPSRREIIHNRPEHLGRVEPGMSVVGPSHDLARLYEALLPGRSSPLFRSELTAELLRATHRTGLRDRGFGGSRIPWGLGLAASGALTGTTGHRAVGHDGLVAGRALMDPAEGLVYVVTTNGLADAAENARRMAEINDAIYDAVAPRPRAGLDTTTAGDLGFG